MLIAPCKNVLEVSMQRYKEKPIYANIPKVNVVISLYFGIFNV